MIWNSRQILRSTSFISVKKHLIYRKLTEEKTKEKDALDESVTQVRSKTTSHINDMHTVVDDKIKTMAWNSHARQTKVGFLEAALNNSETLFLENLYYYLLVSN